MQVDYATQIELSRARLTEGCLFLVDKPKEWTSFDVVNKLRFSIRKTLQVRKYKIGHAGTLDPLATGLLLICCGKYTKKIETFVGLEKAYTGEMLLGQTTPSYDAELLPDQYFPERKFSPHELNGATRPFIGDIEQIAPMYSAVKSKGVALYHLARKGKEVERKPRKVTIKSFQLTRIDYPKIQFDVVCSKGTYIRSLVDDYGRNLDYGAYLTGLRRTRIGAYHVEDAWQLDKLVAHISNL